jgi:hypothetical protein
MRVKVLWVTESPDGCCCKRFNAGRCDAAECLRCLPRMAGLTGMPSGEGKVIFVRREAQSPRSSLENVDVMATVPFRRPTQRWRRFIARHPIALVLPNRKCSRQINGMWASETPKMLPGNRIDSPRGAGSATKSGIMIHQITQSCRRQWHSGLAMPIRCPIALREFRFFSLSEGKGATPP